MKRAVIALALFLLSCSASSCAAVLSVLPAVLHFVDEAEVVLNSIESFEKQFFSAQPDAHLQADVEASVSLARSELDADRATVAAIKNPTPEQVEAAFADFYATYEDVLRVTKVIGVRGVPLGHAVAASRDTLPVPDVRAMHWRVQ